MLFSEPKIPQFAVYANSLDVVNLCVSVLFSEPKIPQYVGMGRGVADTASFSALQRAENSSIPDAPVRCAARRAFQCSSASRKFLNLADVHARSVPTPVFQCSSASRKFLNLHWGGNASPLRPPFQCSSASRKFLNLEYPHDSELYREFQCSSASRKFLNGRSIRRSVLVCRVSVLFSEPKIPQCVSGNSGGSTGIGFQCSSASRKFLNRRDCQATRRVNEFQCSSASRKFLNVR